MEIIKSHEQQLQELADKHNVSLKEAYERSGVHVSTYYRNKGEGSSMRHTTAQLLAKTIIELSKEGKEDGIKK